MSSEDLEKDAVFRGAPLLWRLILRGGLHGGELLCLHAC